MQDGAQNETGQAEAIAFLENGAGIRSGANRVDIHGAIVFMIDDRALKMKRAVQYDYTGGFCRCGGFRPWPS